MLRRLANALRAQVNYHVGNVQESLRLDNLAERAEEGRERIAQLLGELKLTSPPDFQALTSSVKGQTSELLREPSAKLDAAVKATDSWLATLQGRLDSLTSGLNDPKWEKDEVLRTIVHDLKHPVGVIKPYAETLRMHGDQLTPEQRAEYLQTISTACDQLVMQIDDLLDTDPRRPVQLQISEVELGALITEVVAPLERDASLRADGGPALHTFTVEIASEVKPIRADRRELKRVLHNLIGNAVKYSPQGGAVRVRVENAGHAVRVSISDQGVGITPEQQSKLFALFARPVDPALGIKGTGVGLYSAKRLVEAHGGRLWVESEAGQGATFHFTVLKHPASG